jgi:hypothetical protein
MANAIRQLSVRLMLEQGLEAAPLPTVETEAAGPPPVHENIRGAACYQ